MTTNDTITMSRALYDHNMRMAREDGFQEGLYKGIVESAKNAAPKKRVVAQAHVKNGEVVASAVDDVIYDETLYYFLQQTGRR